MQRGVTDLIKNIYGRPRIQKLSNFNHLIVNSEIVERGVTIF